MPVILNVSIAVTGIYIKGFHSSGHYKRLNDYLEVSLVLR